MTRKTNEPGQTNRKKKRKRKRMSGKGVARINTRHQQAGTL
jgi:hypothetical protein